MTSIRFRPDSESAKTKNVILAVSINIDKINVDSDGEIDHWHLTSGKKLHTIKEPGNELYCVDYRQDGLQFVTAGKDYKVANNLKHRSEYMMKIQRQLCPLFLEGKTPHFILVMVNLAQVIVTEFSH